MRWLCGGRSLDAASSWLRSAVLSHCGSAGLESGAHSTHILPQFEATQVAYTKSLRVASGCSGRVLSYLNAQVESGGHSTQLLVDLRQL